MKFIRFGGFFVVVASVAAVIGLSAGSSLAAVTLTVSPSAVSNTYTGPITLNITGLTNGEPVRVQTYLDLNSNGVIQANDPLIDVFDIADGGAQIIGGVTNVSVPYDSNTATGAISTALSFAPSLESVVGQKIYRVIGNPPGAFPPVTAVLSVTNALTGQYASGVVYSNGVTPMTNGVVVALTTVDQKYVGATIVDSSGHYFLALNPGSYFLLPGRPGYYTDQNLLPEVTLTNGMSTTNNLSLTNGTVSVSGSVYDAGNSNALGGVFLQAQSQSLFEVLFTDTNGNYTFYGTSNNWKIKVSDDRLTRRGYLTPQGNAVTAFAGSGPVTNVNIGLYQGNALFYGQVTISNLPIPNITLDGNDSEQFLSSKGFTDMNGNYGIVALVSTNVFGTNSVTWNCAPNTADSTDTAIFTFANYIFSQVYGVSFTNNQSVLQNFIGLPVTATISGQLVNNQGTPIPSIGIGANATIGSNSFTTAYINTDSGGHYSIGAANGQWFVSANSSGNNGLSSLNYYDPANAHVVNIPPTNPVVNIVVYPANLPLLGQPGKVSSSQFNLNLYGASGFNYTVQDSTNLNTVNWSTVTIVSNLPGNPYLIQDFHATNRARFYRAFQGP